VCREDVLSFTAPQLPILMTEDAEQLACEVERNLPPPVRHHRGSSWRENTHGSLQRSQLLLIETSSRKRRYCE
jgi:hypothetical protein